MFLIYKQYIECWLLEKGAFRLSLFLFSSFFSDFRLSGLSMTHAHAKHLIQSPTGFLNGWRHIRPEIFSSRRGSAVSYTSTITVRTGSNRPEYHSKILTSARGEAYLLGISSLPSKHVTTHNWFIRPLASVTSYDIAQNTISCRDFLASYFLI